MMAAAFSYAEAAKGLTPAASVTQTEVTPELPASEPSMEMVIPPPNGKSLAGAYAEPDDAHEVNSDTQDDVQNGATEDSDKKDMSNGAESGHASPTFGTDSAATLLKEDDTNGNLHDGSDSTTWEKASQDSQAAGDKVSKTDIESTDSKLDSWEQVPAPLKEAPPPAVNPWKKRAQDLQSKASPLTTSGMQPSTKSPGFDTVRADNRMDARAPASEASTDRTERPADRLRNSNSKSAPSLAPSSPLLTPAASTRKYKPASETRAASHYPPPPSDAVSWPTPDDAALARPEERRKSISDRAETMEAEKEKAASAKHGRKEWISVPFVPTPVFATPLPTGRRGGRPGGRGGRDGGVPGRGPPHGSTASTADRSPSTQRGEGSVDGSKADSVTVRSGMTHRQKRMSHTGQPRPRDFRKFDDGREERHPKFFDQKLVGARDSSKESRRPAPASEAGEAARNPLVSPSSSRSSMPNGISADPTSPSHDTGSKFHERRFDYGQGIRENGIPREARSERGGRFRGRGGHGPVTGGHQGAYQNGINYPFSPGFSPNKGGYHDQRQGSQAGFGPGREGRHVRAGSRSQPGQGQHFAPRYGMNAAAGMTYPPVPPEMAAGYGFVPSMAPQFYHPYQDQQGLVGMIMEQMRYWFSFDNLIRDLYLRKRMDDNGFVPLSFLMPWKRMQQLTSDVKMVRFACQNVPQVELRVDNEGNEYVRKAQEWEKWVFPFEERHEQAQKEGTRQLQPVFPQGDGSQQSQAQSQSKTTPKQLSTKMPNGSPSHHSASGQEDGTNGVAEATSGNQTPLSATVPEFKPEGLLVAKVNEHALNVTVADVPPTPQANAAVEEE